MYTAGMCACSYLLTIHNDLMFGRGIAAGSAAIEDIFISLANSGETSDSDHSDSEQHVSHAIQDEKPKTSSKAISGAAGVV